MRETGPILLTVSCCTVQGCENGTQIRHLLSGDLCICQRNLLKIIRMIQKGQIPGSRFQ
jgi:hypothetical protein